MLKTKWIAKIVFRSFTNNHRGNPSSFAPIVDVAIVVDMAQKIHTSIGDGEDAIVKLHRVERIHATKGTKGYRTHHHKIHGGVVKQRKIAKKKLEIDMFGFPCGTEQQSFDIVVKNLTYLFCRDVHVKWVMKK